MELEGVILLHSEMPMLQWHFYILTPNIPASLKLSKTSFWKREFTCLTGCRDAGVGAWAMRGSSGRAAVRGNSFPLISRRAPPCINTARGTIGDREREPFRLRHVPRISSLLVPASDLRLVLTRAMGYSPADGMQAF